jgi:sulfate transport system permease protein
MSSPALTRRSPEGFAIAALLGIAAFASAVVLVPLAALVWTTLADLADVARALTSETALHAMALSAIVAVVTVVCNGVFGVAGALVVVRHRFAGRRVIDALVELPLALSPVMTGLAFLLLFGRTGLLRPVLDAVGLQVAFALPGLLLATLFVTLPFTLREVALVLAELGDGEEQAAAMLGATPWQTFWRVTLPNLRGSLVIGTTLTLARALGEFGAVLVIGGAITGKTDTATTFIHHAVEERQESAAYGMALLLAALAVAALGALQLRRSPR